MITWQSVITVVSIFGGLAGVIFGLLNLTRVRKKDDLEGGQKDGIVLTEIGYIKSGVDDIKAEQRDQRKINQSLEIRLVTVEESTKQAHKRIDQVAGVIYPKQKGE